MNTNSKVDVVKLFNKWGKISEWLNKWKILNILEKNSRMTINEISKQVNLSAPAVRERINKMVDLGIIKVTQLILIMRS